MGSSIESKMMSVRSDDLKAPDLSRSVVKKLPFAQIEVKLNFPFGITNQHPSVAISSTKTLFSRSTILTDCAGVKL